MNSPGALDATLARRYDCAPLNRFLPHATPMAYSSPIDRLQSIHLVRERLFRDDAEFAQFADAESLAHPNAGLLDYLFSVGDDPHEPEDIFPRLRWGGVFIYIARSRRALRQMPARFAERGFLVLRGHESLRLGRLPLLSRRLHFFVARKVNLIPPREISDRFTYHVQLVRPGTRDEYVVHKEVPAIERVVARLQKRFPNIPQETVERRARKFTEKIFPLFLTREAAMLKILERDLPGEFAHRVPNVLDLEQDSRGFVRSLRMRWLRMGGRTLSQLEFAKQSAELLSVLHDRVGVIHLDLRLDNFVITPAGVGFVDFGSSVRVGENIQANPLLNTIFDELMRTSEIQRMLEKMTASGAVTSKAISQGYQKVDKAVDYFYLAVQMNVPHRNPDLVGLVRHDPESEEARALSRLTQEVLRPRDPERPMYRSARDILSGLCRLESALKARTPPAAMSA